MRVDDFKALQLMLTDSEDELPETFDVFSDSLDLKVLAGGEKRSMAEWNRRVVNMDKRSPLIVFSKVSDCYSHLLDLMSS